MVDAKINLARRRGGPGFSALARRKIEKLHRMAVGIAEFESAHASILLGQRLRATDGNRLEGDLLQFCVCGVHVADYHGKMLEPEIGASRVGGIVSSWQLVADEFHPFTAQLHRQGVRSLFDAEELLHCGIVKRLPRQRSETQPIAIKGLGPAEIGDRDSDAFYFDHAGARHARRHRDREHQQCDPHPPHHDGRSLRAAASKVIAGIVYDEHESIPFIGHQADPSALSMRISSASDHAWKGHPRGVCGASASAISET